MSIVPEEFVREKLEKLGFDPDLPDKLELRPVPFIELKKELQDEAIDSYIYWWKPVLETEYKTKKWRPAKSHKKMSLNDKIRMEITKQLFTSGNNFPPGQMGLVKTINGKDRLVIFTRSQPWCIYGNNRFKTWYIVSGDGYGYPWVPGMNAKHPVKIMDYKDIGNEIYSPGKDSKLILSNYALTRNMDDELKVKGASKAAIVVNAKYALENRFDSVRTFSPLNNYRNWLEEMIREHPDVENPEEVFTPRLFIEEEALKPVREKRKPRFFTAGGMHSSFGAVPGEIYKKARKDDGSGDNCIEFFYF